MVQYPFEADLAELQANLDHYVDVVFASLESDFLTMPKGQGFVEYPTFETGYEALKQATQGFRNFDPEAVRAALLQTPMIFIVLRVMLGFTPPEWAYMASSHTGLSITQGHARTLDRNIRLAPLASLKCKGDGMARLDALVQTACSLLQEGAPKAEPDKLHRLDKADTKHGLTGLQNLAGMGVPYAMLLYERFLGRPFAGHRDSVSELIGDGLETGIEEVLTKAGLSFRKTKRAEKIPGFDQAPDFILPSEFNPQVVIEAKITEDDGTARDKVTRIQHLAELSEQRERRGENAFTVIACIGGRGFGVRREDMKKLLLATKGKVFTPRTLCRLPKLSHQ
ncbi:MULTISPECIES: hypothetical protein [unclassified Desulfovibrio]|uniref:hypothetical protein n=1 Tax=unclassified Desulfovibrio TaxID=2593640 RepID=UPI000F5ED0A5|nr:MULTISPECIES: hypothetical protein [unclassified Desulfovibrio]RRD69145.1 hypothetical protein EII24_11255 [Desulfovibrio sp. OH1209_COT-279]RRD85473.1 hypothetical protein EII23_11255 [Desulfovibrio sp. OH1186_COT-070]